MEMLTVSLLEAEELHRMTINAKEAHDRVTTYKKTIEFYFRILGSIGEASYDGISHLNIPYDEYFQGLRCNLIYEHLERHGFVLDMDEDNSLLKINWKGE